MSDSITFTIDGVEVTAQEGQTVMEAAEAAGIYIPHLCRHRDLSPAGHCRVCTVKINGRPQSSCTHPAQDGMVVENDTEELIEHRRRIVEMLFIEGNHWCPACEASGECELQAMGYRLGMVAPTLPYFRRKRELDASHPDVYVDRDRCILCGRCVRASVEFDHKCVFGFEGRGADKRITVDAPHGLVDTDLQDTDKAAEICPTGCIEVKREGFATPVGQRKYDKTPIGADIESK
jgi:[NiFe] hydrogenase diaphorase moiety small subunit